MSSVSYEILNAAREVAAIFCDAAGWPGWSEQQRRELESASKAIWMGRNMLLADVDNPGRRRKQRVLLEAQAAAREVDPLRDRPHTRDVTEAMQAVAKLLEDESPPEEMQPLLTTKQVATALNLSIATVEGRARARRLGVKAGPGRRAPVVFSSAEVQAIAKDGRQKASAGG